MKNKLLNIPLSLMIITIIILLLAGVLIPGSRMAEFIFVLALIYFLITNLKRL